MAVWLVSIILVATILLFMTEKVPLDLTSIGVLVALMVTGALPSADALASFSNPAVITVAAMFMLSRGLMRTGALGFLSEKLIEHSLGNRNRILILIMLGTAIPSAFINNTPVVILFLTIIMGVCCRYGLSPSEYLIPISYSAVLGGTCTLIGTSTNIIVSDLSMKMGYGSIRMFELLPLGAPIMAVSLVLLYIAVPRLMPRSKAPVCELRGEEAPHYLAELVVPPGSRLIGLNAFEYFVERFPGVELFELIRGPVIHYPARDDIKVESGDLLFIKATANDLVAVLNRKVVELPHATEAVSLRTRDAHRSLIVELVVTPQSRLVNERPVESGLLRRLGVQLIAVKRRGMHYSEQKIGHLRLTVGDILLIQCSRDKLEEMRNRPDFIVLEDLQHEFVDRKKAPLSLAIFAGMVAAATAGIADITLCALSGVFLMLATECLRIRDAYRSVDVQILLVIVATIALGTAMRQTGADVVYANAFLAPFRGQSPEVVLAAFILLTILITELMSNTATAVLLLPIAISTAASLGVSPRPFIIGICVGSSYGFAIPAGYQSHMLVYGPGGYKFSDFLKLGIPLDILCWLMSSLLIPMLWPFDGS